MVQRVPAHLGETTHESISPWLMIAGGGVLVIAACAVLFMLMGGTSRFGLGVSPTATRTPTITPTPATTILPITLPPESTPVPGPTVATIKYRVKAGDNLTGIAAKYKVTIQSIMEANGMKDDTIRIGDDLIIPLPTPTPKPGAMSDSSPGVVSPTTISLQSPPPSAIAAGTPGVIRYTVQRGDTLITIAAANGSTADAIRAANQLDSDLLSIGQVLLVPVGSWTPTPAATGVPAASATPTSQFAYSAPDLTGPADGSKFNGSQQLPFLRWLSPGFLKANEYYVVHLDYTANGKPKSTFKVAGQATSYRLDASMYPGANPNGTQFSWYVVILSQLPLTSPSQTPETTASSPPSSIWTFWWY